MGKDANRRPRATRKTPRATKDAGGDEGRVNPTEEKKAQPFG
jgi:hypothetical protein